MSGLAGSSVSPYNARYSGQFDIPHASCPHNRMKNTSKAEKERKQAVELEVGDVGTALGRIADRLRAQGLALTGLAYRTAKPGDEDFDVLDEMAASFEREEILVEMMGRNLCRECRTVDIAVLALSTATIGKA